MSDYKNILLALDLTEDAEQVITRALSISQGEGSTLHMIHVVEPISFAYGGDIPMDFSTIQDDIQQQAKQQLSALGLRHNIPAEQQHIVLGRPETEIHNVAEELNADVIVIGSHGRHGLALLLGSTANSVLHGAKCDVLAVRVGTTN
ncbi:universal stress protein [Dasania marina]|uniref:universal stress protein n=1 Tax=Dasania marina TaxID=471499 RepID=UPI00036F95E5|nr:universal stress protein [Dasania marina]